MDVTVLAPEPAATSVCGAFEDDTADVTQVTAPDRLAGFGVVVGPAGDRRFRVADDRLDRWIAVELGGVGGRRIEAVDASVAAFDAESGCYDCLRGRVRAADEVGPESTPRDDRATDDGAGDDRPTVGGVERSAVRFAGALAGRRAVRLLGGARLAGSLVEVPGPERRFQRLPGCDCHEPPTGFERGTRDVSLGAAVDRMERAADERVGLVTEVGERESFPVPYYVARTADTTGFSDVRCGEFGGGAAVDWNEAYAKSVGEALERYAAGVYRTNELRTAPTEAVLDAVPVESFVRPDDARRIPDDRPIAWTDGVELATGEYAALPAGFVYFPPPAEFAPPITTGLGVGNSVDEALRAGVAEVIERDATMLSWYSTFEPLELSVETERFRELQKRARAESLQVTALLCTQDVDVPVVAAAVHREGEWPQFAAGSAAGTDAAAAAADAAAEALQNWTELRGMGRQQASSQGGAIGRYADFPSEARAFVDAATTVSASEVGLDVGADERLDALVSRLTAADCAVYATRLTTSDLAELGFEAVRVVVPSAQPLFTGEAFFGDRAEQVPPELGFEPRLDRAYHPFP